MGSFSKRCRAARTASRSVPSPQRPGSWGCRRTPGPSLGRATALPAKSPRARPWSMLHGSLGAALPSTRHMATSGPLQAISAASRGNSAGTARHKSSSCAVLPFMYPPPGLTGSAKLRTATGEAAAPHWCRVRAAVTVSHAATTRTVEWLGGGPTTSSAGGGEGMATVVAPATSACRTSAWLARATWRRAASEGSGGGGGGRAARAASSAKSRT